MISKLKNISNFHGVLLALAAVPMLSPGCATGPAPVSGSKVAILAAPEGVVPTDHVDALKSHYKKDYIFSSDMFSSRIPLWEKFFANYKGKPNLNYLEVGVFEGASLLWIMENVLTDPSARATGIDNFSSYPYIERRYRNSLKDAKPKVMTLEQRLQSNLRASGARKKVTILKGDSQEILRTLNGKFDLIYIDGSHEAAAVMSDAVNAWRLLKMNGIIIFDDYHFLETFPPELRPKTALDAFVTAFQKEIRIVFRSSPRPRGVGELVLQKIARACPVVNDRLLSEFGQYCYDFYDHSLFIPSSAGRQRFPLSAEEIGLVENLLRTKEIGEADWRLSKELKENKVFGEMAARLNLQLPAEPETSDSF